LPFIQHLITFLQAQEHVILVSIYTIEEKLFIKVKHKNSYEVEKEFLHTNHTAYRNFRVFSHLFISVAKLMVKELFYTQKNESLAQKISEESISCIEEK